MLQSPVNTKSKASFGRNKISHAQLHQQIQPLPSKAEQIEAELKLLEWHKLANNAAIKASLLQTKNIKTTPLLPIVNQNSDSSSLYHGSDSLSKDETARRLRKIAEEELSKPLQVRYYIL